jgi:RNA polymerase sigma-70 factor (ECF subfamily)
VDYDRFFEETYPNVVRALTLALGSVAEAEDVAQEAFARAFVRWREVRTYDRPGTWIYVVAVREAGHRRRRRRTGERLAVNELGTSSGRVDDPGRGVADRDWLQTSLRTLPPRQRLAIVLRYLADLSLAEVADSMQCSVGTVKATIHAALRRLRVDAEVSDDD